MKLTKNILVCLYRSNSVLVEINRHFRGKNILALNAVSPRCLPGITPSFGSSLNIFLSKVVNYRLIFTKPELEHWKDEHYGFGECYFVSVKFKLNLFYEDKITVSVN